MSLAPSRVWCTWCPKSRVIGALDGMRCFCEFCSALAFSLFLFLKMQSAGFGGVWQKQQTG